jgi:hypothetical protein
MDMYTTWQLTMTANASSRHAQFEITHTLTLPAGISPFSIGKGAVLPAPQTVKLAMNL